MTGTYKRRKKAKCNPFSSKFWIGIRHVGLALESVSLWYVYVPYTDTELVINVCTYMYMCAVTHIDISSAAFTERDKRQGTQLTRNTLRTQILVSKCCPPLEGIGALWKTV